MPHVPRAHAHSQLKGEPQVATNSITLQPYNDRVPNPNQPIGKVREIAQKMYLENPFLTQQVIAKLLKVSRARIGQILAGVEKEHEAALKEEVRRLREKYLK